MWFVLAAGAHTPSYFIAQQYTQQWLEQGKWFTSYDSCCPAADLLKMCLFLLLLLLSSRRAFDSLSGRIFAAGDCENKAINMAEKDVY